MTTSQLKQPRTMVPSMYQWTLVMTMIWATLATVNQSHVTAQSALPEVSCSMQTGHCLGEKHDGPSQPHLPKYPSTKAGKQNRSFNQDWFQKFA